MVSYPTPNEYLWRIVLGLVVLAVAHCLPETCENEDVQVLLQGHVTSQVVPLAESEELNRELAVSQSRTSAEETSEGKISRQDAHTQFNREPNTQDRVHEYKTARDEESVVNLEKLQCPPQIRWVPTGVQLAFVICVLLTLRWRTRACCPQEQARCLLLLVVTIGFSNYSITIVDSYDLAKALGIGATFSGKATSFLMLGNVFGSLVAWVRFQAEPMSWKNEPVLMLTVSICLQLLGAIGYITIARNVDITVPHHCYAPLLLASRVLGGIGVGMSAYFLQVTFAHVTPQSERPEQMSRLLLFNTIGIALGPFLAASQKFLDICPHAESTLSFVYIHQIRYELVGFVQIVNCLGVLLAISLWYPSLENIVDHAEFDGHESERQSLPQSLNKHRHFVIIGCLIMSMLRGMSVSGVEVSTPLLLEKDHHWKPALIGITISLTFLAVIPLRWAHSRLKELTSATTWIRFFVVLAILGSVIMRLEPHYDWRLILADVMLFPSIYWADALALGVMQQHYCAKGSLFDAQNAPVWYICATGSGRFLGPIICRAIITRGGQSFYSRLQILVVLSFWGVFEAAVRPHHPSESALLPAEPEEEPEVKDTSKS